MQKLAVSRVLPHRGTAGLKWVLALLPGELGARSMPGAQCINSLPSARARSGKHNGSRSGPLVHDPCALLRHRVPLLRLAVCCPLQVVVQNVVRRLLWCETFPMQARWKMVPPGALRCQTQRPGLPYQRVNRAEWPVNYAATVGSWHAPHTCASICMCANTVQMCSSLTRCFAYWRP